MTPTNLALSAIKSRMNPAEHHKVLPEADLSDLIPCAFDRTYSLAADLEEALGHEFTEAELARWRCVADVVRSVEGVGV